MFCSLNTDIQTGTLFWGKVLSCPTQVKNFKILNEEDLKNYFYPPLFVSYRQGRNRAREVRNLGVETCDSISERLPGPTAPPREQADPLEEGTSHLLL